MITAPAYLGLSVVIAALWLDSGKSQDLCFLVGGLLLTVFSVKSGDRLFTAFQIIAVAAALVKLAKIWERKPFLKSTVILSLTMGLIAWLWKQDDLAKPLAWFAVAGMTCLNLGLGTGKPIFFIPCSVAMLVYSASPYFGFLTDARVPLKFPGAFSEIGFVIALLNIAMFASALRATFARHVHG